MPYIVAVIEGMHELFSYGEEYEALISRLADIGRTVGIHLILSTQCVSAEAITPMIRHCIPSRISFKTATWTDSKRVLEKRGAEKLVRHGEMYYYPMDRSSPMHMNGCTISDEEILRVVHFFK